MRKEVTVGSILMRERFTDGLDGWWVEGGQEALATLDGALSVRADPEEAGAGDVCTVWYARPFPPNVAVELLLPVQCGFFDDRISNPRPQSLGRCLP